MAEPNPFLGKSAAELQRQMALLTQALEADGAVSHVVAAAALKWSIDVLKGPKDSEGKFPKNKLGAAWETITPPMMPREANLAKPGGLSESQVQNIKDDVEKALGAIKLR